MKIFAAVLLAITCSLNFSAFAQVNLNWVHSFGDSTVLNNSAIYCSRVCTDDQGNVYMTGSFAGDVDFDPSPTSTALLSSGKGSFEFFLVKFYQNGSLGWARQFHCKDSTGNPFQHYGYSMGSDLELDSAGNIYVCGNFSQDHIAQISGIDTSWIVSNWGEMPAFFAKYKNNGDLIWAKNLDCTHGVNPVSINVDPNGYFYLFGQYDQTVDLDPGPGVFYIHGSNYHGNGYLAKYDTAANFIWGTYMRGGNNWTMHSALNSHGDITITGFYADSLSFPNDPQFNSLYPNNHYPDGYIIQFSQSGHIKWIKNFSQGSTLCDVEPYTIDIDSRNNIIIAGAYQDTIDLNPPFGGATQIAGATICESFFAKYDSLGNYLWSNTLHGDLQNFISAATVSIKDDIYITGYYVNHCDMDPSDSVYNLTTTSFSNYLGKYSTDGSLIWATKLSGNYIVNPMSISAYGNGNIYLSGYFKGIVDFDLTPGIYNVSSPMNAEFYGFLAKYIEYYDGIEENAYHPQYSVYPNPALNTIRINTTQQLQYEIFNGISAKIIPIQNYMPGDDINISGLTPGIYFMHLKIPGNQIITLKFIKLPD